MKLKKAIQIIEYSNLLLLVGLFIGVLAVVQQSRDGKFLVFEMLFAIPFILTFFFRKIIVNLFLKKSKYPGAFYAVLDKLGLAHNLEIDLTDELLDEIHKPRYSTDDFLRDNDLITEIGSKKVSIPFPLIFCLLSLFAFLYLGKNGTFQNMPLLLIVFAGSVVVNFYIWVKARKSGSNDNAPLVKFNANGLFLTGGRRLDWKSIYDWNFDAGGKTRSAEITVNYYNEEGQIQDVDVNLSLLNIDKVDFLLLIAHFKGKYG